MKKFCLIVLALAVGNFAFGQEEIRIEISDFDDNLAWAYSGASVIESFVSFPDEIAPVVAIEGENVLYVEYEYGDPYREGDNWAPLNFPGGGIDLTVKHHYQARETWSLPKAPIIWK